MSRQSLHRVGKCYITAVVRTVESIRVGVDNLCLELHVVDLIQVTSIGQKQKNTQPVTKIQHHHSFAQPRSLQQISRVPNYPRSTSRTTRKEPKRNNTKNSYQRIRAAKDTNEQKVIYPLLVVQDHKNTDNKYINTYM